MGEDEPRTLEIGPTGHGNHFGVRFAAAPAHIAGKSVEAFRQICFNDFDPLVFQRRCHARNRVNPALPNLAQLVGESIHCLEILDPIVNKFAGARTITFLSISTGSKTLCFVKFP